MNNRLIFSWGHIVAIISWIIMGYIIFMGMVYYTKGNFSQSVIVTGVLLIFLLFTFLLIQQLKATDGNFSKNIKYERFLLILSILFFVVSMIPFSHFWNIHDKKEQISDAITEAIFSSKQMFDNYDKYANERVNNYEQYISNTEKDEIKKQVMVETLKTQMLSSNNEALKTSATKWIDNASQNASVWNIFLTGNIDNIKSIVGVWHDELDKLGSRLSNEPESASFSEKYPITLLYNKYDKVSESFSNISFMPNINATVLGILLYIMLIFPYIIQDRHTKSTYRIIGKDRKKQINIIEKKQSDITIGTIEQESKKYKRFKK